MSDTVDEACQTARDAGWSVSVVDPPEYCEDDAVRCLDSCAQNLCKCYGTSWSCPPGWTERLDSLLDRFDSAVLLDKRFDIDPKDESAMDRAGSELKTVMRRMYIVMRGAGIDCMGFADGRCDYCGVCSYPEPCRFPEQLIPSISATGTDLGKYLGRLGKGFSFDDGHVTLYGLLLYRL